MVKILKNTLSIALVTSFLTNCAGIPAGKVKLENYPEIKKEEVVNLSLSYKEINFEPKKKGENFNLKIGEKLQSLRIQNAAKFNTNCIVEISSNNDYGQSNLCKAEAILTGFTLFIIPAYCYWNYEAKATLISTKDNKILKEYYLKDKVHEVWSSLWMLSWFVVDSWGKGPTPEKAKYDTENTISEALVRSILNDASNLEECRKK